jgi:hypothetical protein
MTPTTFYRLARTLTVKDVCSPIICAVHDSELLDDLHSHWLQDTLIEPEERWDDGTASIVLVGNDDGIYGWYDFRTFYLDPDWIYDEIPVGANIPIGSKAIKVQVNGSIDAEKPLLFAFRDLSDASVKGLFVQQGEDIVGLLRPTDVYKMEGRICLLSLILAIEAGMLERISQRPKGFKELLGTKQWEKLEKRAKSPRNPKNSSLNERDIFAETQFRDKVKLLTEDGRIQEYVPEWQQYQETLIELRNKIAHQHDDDTLVEILPVDKMLTFVQWMLELHQALVEGPMLNTFEVDEDELVFAPPDE